MIYEEALPVYDLSVQVAVTTSADRATAWDALDDLDLIELGRRRPLVGALSAIRGLPMIAAELLRGRRRRPMPDRMRLRDLIGVPAGEGGWVLLGERPGEELALGLVGRFWRPAIEFAEVDAGEFAAFDRPGYAKTVYSFGFESLDGGGAMLCATMRTATTDERSRRRFRRYWTLGVGAGAEVLVNATLERLREIAESRDAATRP